MFDFERADVTGTLESSLAQGTVRTSTDCSSARSVRHHRRLVGRRPAFHDRGKVPPRAGSDARQVAFGGFIGNGWLNFVEMQMLEQLEPRGTE